MHQIYFSEEGIYCQRKKFVVLRRNFLTEEETSWQRKKFSVWGRNYLSEQEISFWRKKFLVRVRNFLSKEGISCQRKEFVYRGRNFLSEEEILCQRRKFCIKCNNKAWIWTKISCEACQMPKISCGKYPHSHGENDTLIQAKIRPPPQLGTPRTRTNWNQAKRKKAFSSYCDKSEFSKETIYIL